MVSSISYLSAETVSDERSYYNPKSMNNKTTIKKKKKRNIITENDEILS